jgi:hypothetical protein
MSAPLHPLLDWRSAPPVSTASRVVCLVGQLHHDTTTASPRHDHERFDRSHLTGKVV